MSGGVRVDKFLWCVRITKTRSLATDLIKKGKISINGEQIKPSRDIKIGDVIGVSKANATFEYKVIDLLNKRVGAKLVENHIIDCTTDEEKDKYKTYQLAQRAYKGFGTGKPSKKERRALDDFLDWENE